MIIIEFDDINVSGVTEGNFRKGGRGVGVRLR